MKIEHIVFDIGNVLIGWDRELAYLEQIPDPTARHWFLENVCSMDWVIEQDRGRDWREAEQLLAEKYPNHAASIRHFRANWEQMIIGEISETVEIYENLIANNYDVTLLTNFASDTFDIAFSRFRFLSRARGMTVSGRVGLVKPEIEIYHHHQQRHNLVPDRTLFIDDVHINIEGALSAGWQAVQFQNAKTLKDDLERLGVDL